MNPKPNLAPCWCLLSFAVVFFSIIFCGNSSATGLSNKDFTNPEKIPPLTGTVKDSTGNPLSGVSVKIKGTSTGTITNENGSFSLQADVGAILEFSAVGYETQELTVGSNAPMEVVLKRATSSMDEVVVIGYGAQKKANITGAVSSVNVGQVTDLPVTNLSNALAGRAAGVTVVNTSGLAGASSKINVRGAFGEPLYVIDGILKTKQDFDALDPNEIDQLNVLKDAATASVYGAQAGTNGVVIITTKRGSSGKPVFSAQVSYTNARPTATLLSDQTRATDDLIYQNRATQWSNVYNNQNAPLPNDQDEFDYFKDKSYNINDWIWRNPNNQKYLLSVNGGGERVDYYSMVSYTKEQGSFNHLDYKKFNLRSNVNAKISDAISMNLNISAAQQNPDRFYWPFTGVDDYDVSDFYRTTFNWPKLYPFYLNADGSPSNQITQYAVQTPMGSWQAWNVVDVVEGERYIKTRRRQVNGILSLDIKLDKITKGLSTKVVGNYEANDFMRKWWLNYQTNYTFNSADPTGNRFIPAAPVASQINIFSFSQAKPFLRYDFANGWKYQLNWFLNYDRSFGAHNINAMAAFEQTEQKTYNARATGMTPLTNIDQMFVYSQSAGDRTSDASEFIRANQSWIGRLNYSYDQRYIAEFSFRYDGLPLIVANKIGRWGFFPAGSLAWRISQESFFKNSVPWVNELKLRAGYGTTGNLVDVNNVSLYDYVPLFRYTEVLQNSSGYIYNNTLYTTVSSGPAPTINLTWATNYNTNIGLDFALLSNRLSGSVDVFENKMKNILGPRAGTVSPVLGRDPGTENYAARSFRGTDLSLQWKDRVGEISYSVYGNFGYAKDRWDVFDQNPNFLPGGPQSFANAIGYPADRIYGFEAEGLIRTQDQLDALIAKGYNYYGRKPYLGGILIKDIRGQGFSNTPDGKIDDNDITVLSNNAKPRVNYGIGFTVSWKGLSIDALFQGVGAYDKIIGNQEGPGIRQWGGNFRTYYPIWAGDVWTPENPNGKYPGITGQNWVESGGSVSTSVVQNGTKNEANFVNGAVASNTSSYNVSSSFWLRNGAYTRLRNLNIAYNFPANWSGKLGLSSAQIFLNGTNLFSFSKMKEFQDPEQLNYDSYPIMKTFTVGLNIKF